MKHPFKYNPFPKVSGDFPSNWNHDEMNSLLIQSGVSVYEDEKHVTIEAAMPGLKSSEIDVTHNHGHLLIEGKKTEEKEDPEKTYYTKARSSFCYRILLPTTADEQSEPQAVFKDGLMRVTFKKVSKKKKD